MRKLIKRAIRNRWHYAYLFILPVLFFFSWFRVYPSVQTLVFSFFNVNIVTNSYKSVGLSNFAELLQDGEFLQAAANTLIYAFWIVIVATALGMVVAAVFSGLRGASFFKAVYFTPYITSTVAAAVVWSFLYDPRFGLFNAILRLLSLAPQSWIASSKQSLMSVIIFSVWKSLGYNMVLFTAGILSIPATYFEAAIMDGASALRMFFRITVPLLAPTTVFVVVYNTILALKVFAQVFVLTAGGPANSSNVVVLEIYKQAFLNYRFGYAASMAFLLFIFLASMTVLEYRLSRRWEVQY